MKSRYRLLVRIMSLLKLLLPFICVGLANRLAYALHSEGDIEEAVREKLYRLPNTIIPTSYELRIDTNLNNFTFSGTVRITIHVRFATRQVILHSRGLTIEDIQLTNNDTARIHHSYKFDKPSDLLIIETAENLIYNTDYSLAIQFRGILNNKNDSNYLGFYRARYVLDGQTRWLAATQFESDFAREAFPCFDEFRFRAPFTIYLAHSKDHVAISNMPSEEVLPQESSNGTRVWEKFQQTPPLSTYLVAFVISDLKSITSEDGRIRVFARPNAIDKCSYALQQSIKVIDYLEGYTGIKFKLPKIDVVALPEANDGAMENWGISTYREDYVILPESNDEKTKHEITKILLHELGHQWFGDLVTPSWYSYLWLKEGFATYFESFAETGIGPSKNLDSHTMIETKSYAFLTDAVRAMTTTISKVDEIDEVYDGITYNKGGSVIRMLAHAVTPDTFQAALHNFLKDGAEKQHGIVTQHDLFDAFDKQVERDAVCQLPKNLRVSDFLKGWTENIGHPLITVTRSYENGEITITQTTYQSLQMADTQSDPKWIVPLTYTTKSEQQFSNTKPTLWSFADTPITLQDKVNDSEWILFNLQDIGYYRVNYDDRNWQLIIDQLNEDKEKIHPLNRAQLISDVIALSIDNMLNSSIAEALLRYLPKETDLIPWYSLAISFDLTPSESDETSVYSSLKKLARILVKTPLKIFGFDVNTTDTHLVALKPVFLKFACNVGYEDCIQQSLDEYKNNEDNITEIQTHLQEVVYCSALRHMNDTEKVFNNLWNVYTTTDDNTVKSQILKSLLFCAGHNEDIIKNLLSKLTNPENAEIAKSDAFQILKETNLETTMISSTMKFIEKRVSKISNLTDDNVTLLEDLLRSVESKIKTSEQMQLLKTMKAKSAAFHQKHGKLSDIIKKLYAKLGKTSPDDVSLVERFRKKFASSQKNAN